MVSSTQDQVRGTPQSIRAHSIQEVQGSRHCARHWSATPVGASLGVRGFTQGLYVGSAKYYR